MKFMHRITLLIAGLAVLLCGWHYCALWLGDLLMATPIQAIQAMWQLLNDPHAQAQLWLSIQRMLQGIGIGCSIGITLGMLAGFSHGLRVFLSPFRWLLMAIPPVILVVLAMLWFGMGSTMVVFIASVLLAPGIYVNTEKAIRMIDPKLREMVRVYQFGLVQKIRCLYMPAIAAPLSAALLIALCNGVRIVVLAEVLGSHQGIGYALASARSNFDSHQLYGWVLLVLLIVAALEWLVLQPVQHYLTRWQREPSYVAS